MDSPPELDDKTLALLLAISDLVGKEKSASEIAKLFDNSLIKVGKFRTDGGMGQREWTGF
jgi:hypothetical protein